MCIDFPLVGRFLRRRNESTGDGADENKFCFVPHIDFVSSGRFSFAENDCNISPLSKRVPRGVPTVKVSLGAIGSVCNFDKDIVVSILKDIMVKFVSQLQVFQLQLLAID